MSRAAVVVNPTKVTDAFTDTVARVMTAHGWAEPMWLETTPEDPGAGQAAQAVRANVDLVIAAGGDGTVTACAAGMTGSDVPLAIVAAGTGNLLAFNLGIPLDTGRALRVALTGSDRQVDVGLANGRPFVVMAGLGFDAKMLTSTSPAAKKRFGYAAYVVAGLRHLRDRPMRVTVAVDGQPPRRHRATCVIVGNVGWLQGGLRLLPDATADDGLLDVVILKARGLTSWLILLLHVLLRRETSQAFRRTFRELTIHAEEEQPWELDGEVAGTTRDLAITVSADRLTLRAPAYQEGSATAAWPPAATAIAAS